MKVILVTRWIKY